MADTAIDPTEKVETIEVPRPDVSHLVTEDDIPVDNWHSEKNRRLGTEPLYSSWSGPAKDSRFLVASDVALYAAVNQKAVVPDIFLSLGVNPPDDWWEKGKRSYFFWEFGKSPDVVIEIVSNKIGNEADEKFNIYAIMGIPYYAVFDPLMQVQSEELKVYALTAGRQYEEISPRNLAGIGLGLTLWDGVYEDKEATWLRWIDSDGNLIATGKERADSEQQRANSEQQRANSEQQRADLEKQRADSAEKRANVEKQAKERLAAKLRELGIDPDNI